MAMSMSSPRRLKVQAARSLARFAALGTDEVVNGGNRDEKAFEITRLLSFRPAALDLSQNLRQRHDLRR